MLTLAYKPLIRDLFVIDGGAEGTQTPDLYPAPFLVVECTGFEPVAFAMRMRRSTS